MRIAGSLVTLLLIGLLPLAVRSVDAAGPAITISSPANGTTVHGTSLTVAVTVSNFRLVNPVFSHPPVLKGFAGSLQYILDGAANYSPRRDLTAATTHTWTNVAPGAHTVLVRLATSQHLPWPNGPVAKVRVTVAPVARPAPRRHAGGASPGVHAAPTTGGAGGLAHSSLNLTVILFACLLVVLGLSLLGRRLVFAGAGGRRRAGVPAPIAPPAATQAFSVMPSPGEQSDPGSQTFLREDVFPAEEPAPDSALSSAAAAEPFADNELPAPAVAGDPEGFSVPSEPASPAGSVEGEVLPRERAIEMARQWSGVVESLVRQLDEQEAERQRMLDHIRLLEDRMRGTQALHDRWREASAGGISAEDFQTLRYLTDALERDPDHIVNLAAVAQHAAKFHDLVDAYARLRQALNEP